MADFVQRFVALKAQVGGNREKNGFEWTFGPTGEEQYRVTAPAPHQRRILSQLDFAIKLNDRHQGAFAAPLDQALTILEKNLADQGALTRDQAEAAEQALMPMAQAAAKYRVICAAHAHIDMDWMWSYDETVAATLATFRTMLQLMDEYPDFHFSQSQTSVYRIVEQYDPEMMRRMQQRIREGRWEITSTAWVETDKNMPDTESLLRHIRQTRDYLREVWGIDPDSLQVDFSPDTFGHSRHVPEINNFGNVKYYYHCRGRDSLDVLYRWRAPSNREILVYREPCWYNGAVTPDAGTGIFEMEKHSGGLTTALLVYGVGDHGGGPTRRDIERVHEIQQWPVFPRYEFGSFAQYFAAAETVRDQVNLAEHELNFIFAGCYTTQSRIKRGNRRSEAALLDAEAAEAVAHFAAGLPAQPGVLDGAWRDVLYTHFHDILTGSCVQDSREHAMGLYQEALARARTVRERALRGLSEAIDTSMVPEDPDHLLSQSEGAGVGFGAQSLSAMTPAERGRGRVRPFHIFNPLPQARKDVVELTVWDWTYDLRRARMTDEKGKPLPFELKDKEYQRYWDHRYFRLLVQVEVPALGYATVVLDEAPPESYPTFRLDDVRYDPPLGAFVLENAHLKATFDGGSGDLVSLLDKQSGQERIQGAAGLRVERTEKATSSAWKIGRYLSELPAPKATRVYQTEGKLRQGLVIEQSILSSTMKITVSLDQDASALAYELEVDWHESARDHDNIPVLLFCLPLAQTPQTIRMDVPGGSMDRPQQATDVPGLTHAAAVYGDRALMLATDCKYGYRADGDRLISTLINTADSPDLYPERGIHPIRLWVHAGDAAAPQLKRDAQRLTRPLAYLPTTSHRGTLPATGALLEVRGQGAVVTSVGLTGGGSLLVRLYEGAGQAGEARLILPFAAKAARLVDLDGKEVGPAKVEGTQVTFGLQPYRLCAVSVDPA